MSVSRTAALAASGRRAIVAAVLLAAFGCSAAGRHTTAPALVESWLTTPDRAQLLARQPDITSAVEPPDTLGTGATRIEVDTAKTFQSMVGFGAALTDASAWLLQTRLSPAQREALLQELFSPDSGIALGMVRLTVGGSDFSRAHYTFDDVAPGERDDALRHFDIAPNRADVIPLMRRVRAINPDLWVMATPWSAPAWMKSSGSLYKGTLRPDAYAAYAEYLRRLVDAFAAEGVPIALLSVQNEPHNEPADYPGMRLTADQRADFVAHHLGPLFARRQLATQVVDWDHNWDAPESPLGVLADSLARRYISGVAWHCYAGDVAAQSRVHEAHPDKDTWFTECSGGAWAPNFGDNLKWNVRTLIIGATRHWARGVMLWNLALDERHGPHAGGCNDCRGVVTIDSATGAVTRNEEYYALAHASRFVRPGAVRIASSSGVNDIETVAFRNRDGTKVLIAVNSADVARTLAIQATGGRFPVTLPAGAVATYRWR